MGLLPEEEHLLAGALERRRREFAAGRSCARRALARLGWPNFAVLKGPNREPIWPPGVLGSITHCGDYCAAAAGRVEELGAIQGLGIDAELNVPLPDSIAELICTPAECRSLVEAPGVNAPALLFSAKESVYKAWFPIAGRWRDYRDAEIDCAHAARRRAVRLPPSALPGGLQSRVTFSGRFGVTATHVFTLVVAIASVAAPPSV